MEGKHWKLGLGAQPPKPFLHEVKKFKTNFQYIDESQKSRDKE